MMGSGTFETNVLGISGMDVLCCTNRLLVVLVLDFPCPKMFNSQLLFWQWISPNLSPICDTGSAMRTVFVK
jgi:hypothetical protein